MKKYYVTLAVLFLSMVAISQTIYENYVDGEIYFKLKDDYFDQTSVDKYGHVNYKAYPWLKDLLSNYKVRSIRKPFWMTGDTKLERTFHLKFIDFENVDNIVRDIKRLPYVDYVEKVAKRDYIYTPNDKAVSDGNQSYLHKIKCPGAWDHSKGNNIVIAITDSGTDTNHPDLVTNLWKNTGEIPNNFQDDDGNGYVDDIYGYDVAGNKGDPEPTLSAPHPVPVHGTHVAGIAGADTDNGKGLGSVGFNAKIMIVKNAASNGALTNAAESVTYAAVNGADVINISWGGLAPNTTEQNAINFAETKGSIIIGGAGNNGQNAKFYPAAFNNVISVAGTDDNDVLGTWSNRGTWIDLCAPGTDILSIIPLDWVPPGGQNNPGVMFLSGTSHSAPIISGVVALMLSVNPSMSIADVRNCLKSTAVNIDAQNSGNAGLIGAGRVDAEAAVLCAKGGQSPTADAGIFTINQPAGTVCDGAIAPLVRIKNFGSSTLTSLDIEYSYNGLPNPAQKFSWTGSLNSGSVALVTLPNFNLVASTTAQPFTVTAKNPNGTSDADASNDSKTNMVTVDNCSGINDISLAGIRMEVFPNPSKGLVNIRIEDNIEDPLTVELIDITGKIVYSGQILARQQNHLLNLSETATGIYSLRFQNDTHASIVRLVLK